MAELTDDDEENDPVMKENVSKWLDLSVSIKRAKKKVSDLLSAQKLIENEIIRSMKEKELDIYEMFGGKTLKIKRKESKQPVTPKWTKEKLLKLKIDNNTSAKTKELIKELMDEIEHRPVKAIKETLVHDGA